MERKDQRRRAPTVAYRQSRVDHRRFWRWERSLWSFSMSPVTHSRDVESRSSVTRSVRIFLVSDIRTLISLSHCDRHTILSKSQSQDPYSFQDAKSPSRHSSSSICKHYKADLFSRASLLLFYTATPATIITAESSSSPVECGLRLEKGRRRSLFSRASASIRHGASGHWTQSRRLAGNFGHSNDSTIGRLQVLSSCQVH